MCVDFVLLRLFPGGAWHRSAHRIVQSAPVAAVSEGAQSPQHVRQTRPANRSAQFRLALMQSTALPKPKAYFHFHTRCSVSERERVKGDFA